MLVEPINNKEKDIVFLYTTCNDRAEARSIAFAVINEKLAVCADYWAIESIYPWSGIIEDVEQYMLVLTTERKLVEKLTFRIREMHSYLIPVIYESDSKMKNSDYTVWAITTLEDQKGYLTLEEKEKKDRYDAEGNFHPGYLK